MVAAADPGEESGTPAEVVSCVLCLQILSILQTAPRGLPTPRLTARPLSYHPLLWSSLLVGSPLSHLSRSAFSGSPGTSYPQRLEQLIV